MKHPRTPRKPFKPGDRIGALKIGRYIKHTDLNLADLTSETRKYLTNKFHWYMTECDCGRIEPANQQRIRDRKCCTKCARKRKHAKTRTTPNVRVVVPAGIPDFATLRLVSDEMLAVIEAMKTPPGDLR
jgi:hypothetical protein